jgi:hypothetical protein
VIYTEKNRNIRLQRFLYKCFTKKTIFCLNRIHRTRRTCQPSPAKSRSDLARSSSTRHISGTCSLNSVYGSFTCTARGPRYTVPRQPSYPASLSHHHQTVRYLGTPSSWTCALYGSTAQLISAYEPRPLELSSEPFFSSPVFSLPARSSPIKNTGASSSPPLGRNQLSNSKFKR